MNTSNRLRILLALVSLPLSSALCASAPEPSAVPRASSADPARVTASPLPQAAAQDSGQDSAMARKYRMAGRPFNRQELKDYQTALRFKPVGKAESSDVLITFRDGRGAALRFETTRSEWAYANDSVRFLAPQDIVPDSLIQRKTDGHLKTFLKDKAAQYAFVNHEVTMVQERDTASKEGVKPPVPAYYIGRYLRKLDGRYVLGDNFQARIGVGRANALQFISFRDPVIEDSSLQIRVPTRRLVEKYPAQWSRQPERLGTRYYPYHPDKLRIRKLKPVRVFESYVLVAEKFQDNPSRNGIYLVPRITVLAEADLARSTKKQKSPHPSAPVLLHFHFPCTPEAGLCWPDGKQGLEDGVRTDMRPFPPAPAPIGTAPTAPKNGPVPAPPKPTGP